MMAVDYSASDDCELFVCCSDGLPSSALSASGPGSAPPPSSTLDNFAPPPASSSLPQQPPSTAPGKLPYPNCGPPTSSQGPPQPLSGAPRPGHGPLMDGGAGAIGGFMPQQSQVFVFSTSMANQAAEAVERGLCRTIIDFHIEQPRTRHFLQVSHIRCCTVDRKVVSDVSFCVDWHSTVWFSVRALSVSHW